MPTACAAATCGLRGVHGHLSGPVGATGTPFMPVPLTGLAVRDGGRRKTVPQPRWSVDRDDRQLPIGFSASFAR
jgi:hypothetical protein